MAPRPERLWRRLGGRAIAAALVALAVIPAYLGVSPVWRPSAVRLACAVVAALACARVVRWARRTLGASPPSALDAPPPAPAPVPLDGHFVTLRDDVVASARSRRYFDVILWPRLGALAGRELAHPAPRPGLRRRGPAFQDLERLVADIERPG